MGLTSSIASYARSTWGSMFGTTHDQARIDGWHGGSLGPPVDRMIQNPYPPPFQNPQDLDVYSREASEMRFAYQRFYASEPTFQSAIDGKIAAIASLDVGMLPADENAEADKKAAEFCRDAISNCPGGFSGLIENILRPAFLTGYSVTEKWLGAVDDHPCFDRLRPKWNGLWAPRRLASIDPNYLRFQLDETRQITGVINTRLGLQGYSPDRVMIFTHRKMFENPYGRSDGRSAYRACQLIENAYKLWYVAIKNYSAPFVHVKTSSKGAILTALQRALDAARAGGWLTTSREDDVQLLNFANAASFQAFERKVMISRQEIYLAVRGSWLPFLEGSQQDGRGDSQVHKVASDAIESMLVQSVCEVVNQQLVPDLTRPNFGQRCGLSTMTLGGTNWNETKAQLDVIRTVEKDLGRPVSTKLIYKISQQEPPRDDADGPPKPPEPAPQPGGMGFPFSELMDEYIKSKVSGKTTASDTPLSSPTTVTAISSGKQFNTDVAQRFADVIVTNNDSQVLLLLRSKDDDFCPGQWCLPGGKVEDGEVPLAAAVREAAEETGIELDELKRFKDFNNPDGSISHTFTAKANSGTIKTDTSEHANHLWVSDTRESYPKISFMLQTKDRLDEYFKSREGGAASQSAATFSDTDEEPVADPPDAQIAGRDGQAAMRLAEASMEDGRDVLESIAHDAVKRRLNDNTGPLFDQSELELLAEAIASSNATAELLGRYRVRERVEQAQQKQRRFARFDEGPDVNRVMPLVPERALAFFRSLMPSLSAIPSFAERLRRQAFTLAVNTGEVILRKIQDSIAAAINEGRSGTQDVQSLLDEAGVSSRNPQYSDMVFRTNAMDSFNIGHDEERQQPDVIEEFPAWQYLGIEDGRQGKDHQPKFGQYYPASASFAEVRGDRPFNCRCSQRAISRSEWAKLQAKGVTLQTNW